METQELYSVQGIHANAIKYVAKDRSVLGGPKWPARSMDSLPLLGSGATVPTQTDKMAPAFLWHLLPISRFVYRRCHVIKARCGGRLEPEGNLI